MAKLKDRNRQIPNGLFFYLAQTKWKSSPGSFTSIVTQLGNHLRGNPLVARQLGWNTDDESLANRVDAFNASVCEHMGWRDYILEGGQTPKAPAPSHAAPRSAAVAAGVDTLRDWLGEGGKPVDQTVANARAEICASCPSNEPGDWLAYFTEPAAAYIRHKLEQRQKMKLSTPFDDKLQVCRACYCPLQLKCHTPIKHIQARMPASVKAALDPRCWVLKEMA